MILIGQHGGNCIYNLFKIILLYIKNRYTFFFIVSKNKRKIIIHLLVYFNFNFIVNRNHFSSN